MDDDVHPVDRASTRGLLDALTTQEVQLLQAVIDTIIPEDEWPGGWRGGVATLLENPVGAMDELVPVLRAAVTRVDDVARSNGGQPFLDLDPRRRLELLESEYAADVSRAAPEPPTEGEYVAETAGAGSVPKSISSLVTLAFDGFYSGRGEPAGWEMVGFRPVPDGVVPVDGNDAPGIAIGRLLPEYEVVVIGAGAGGGVAACELAEAGLGVLVVERARPMRDSELRGNHVQGKRNQLYGVTAGPGAGSPRVHERPDGTQVVLRGDGNMGAYGLNAMALGGGTRVWQGMAWRFYDEDFRMASTYGVPQDTTVADWPFDYSELAPYYDRVEWELGVSGDATSPALSRVPRTRGLPMPAFPDDDTRRVMRAAADSLGWSTSPIPFALNSVPRDGRAACVRCAQNVGQACPVDAKNGTHNTFIPRALRAGAHLLMNSQVVRIDHDGRGTATAVRLVIDTPDGPVERLVRAGKVVVSAGAIETPRLLLASGLGNDWVGRNHHSHGFGLTVDLGGRSPKTYTGPGHSVATSEWLHRDGLAWGGGIITDNPTPYPGQKAPLHLAAGIGLGASHKQWMRDTPPPLGLLTMTNEAPHVSSRITVDGRITDRHGMPAARLAGRPSGATRTTVDFMVERSREWLEAAGGTRILATPSYGFAVGNEHSAGTARLGDDPATSACDPRGRLWGTTNVWVADASVHVTNGGVNPALSAMANSLRIAGLIVRDRGATTA